MSTIADPQRFQQAIAEFDAINQEDPNQDTFEGKNYPKELLYSQRMSACLERFAPDASEAMQLAARAQHIARWSIPRSQYPMDRKGYKRWRKELQIFHADKAKEVLSSLGYEEDLLEQVETLILKKNIKGNPEVQTFEDVICLVFLEFYLEDFLNKNQDYTAEKVIKIIQKTWAKMSETGHEAALKLPLSENALQWVQKALA